MEVCIVSNEDKIISMLTDIQNDISKLMAAIDNMNNDNHEDFLTALDRFCSDDTPKDQAEIYAFLKFMDAEEERKRAHYDLSA